MRSHSTLTFLFTDIEGSTRRWELSAGMHDRVEEHFDVLREAIDAAGGEVFATMGDGVAAAFGSADDAVRAAISAQRRLPITGLPVRMGIHTGEARRSGRDYRGRPVNRAARIAGCAHGGQVLVSETSAALLRAGGSDVDLLDLGVHHLRDLSEPEHLWQLAAPDLARYFPQIRVPAGADTTLPERRSTLVGREADIVSAAGLVSAHSLVTLVGVGGVGKTRLAIATATSLEDRFDAVHFVNLCPVDGGPGADDVVAAAIPAPEARRTALYVLDNCEHVSAAVAGAVDRLLAVTGNHVLATSRERLGLEGERIVPVRPLRAESAAVELFRARAADAGLELSTGDEALVADICRRVDGIPLAIELAAARAPTVGLPGLRTALDGRLAVLASSRRGPARHQTMARTIDWSTRLLEDDARHLLEWLAAFSGGFELDGAVHVGAAIGLDADRVIDLVDSLVAQSLVEVEHPHEGARYRMLRLVRTHALDALDRRGELATALSCQADCVAAFCDLPVADLCSAAVERRAVRLEREVDNWRQAVVWAVSGGEGLLDDDARSQLIARLCGPPAVYFLLARHELADLVSRLPNLCTRSEHLHAALSAAAMSSAGAGDAVALRAMSDEIRRLEPDRPTGMATLIDWIACTWSGEIEAGVDVCLAAADDPRLAPDTRNLFLGIATTDRFSLTDRGDRREELAERCLAVAATTGVRTHRAACLLGAAWAALSTDPDRATDLVDLALDEIPFLPSYVRQTLPGNASRFLSSVDPARAACDLAEQIGQIDIEAATFSELIPVVYATALLERVGHPSAEPALAALRTSPVATYVEMVGLSSAGPRRGLPTGTSELAAVVDDLHAALTEAELS